MTFPLHILAAPTADQVFKSMGETMSASVNPLHIVGAFALLVGVLVLLSILTKKRDPREKPKPVNNPAKLLKELSRQAGLRPRELRQLKALAEQQHIENPLVLLICPSVLRKAMQNRTAARK